jgi:hypothetical protein
MNGRTIARALVAVILIAAAIGLGVTAYNVGVNAGLAQNGTVTVAPGFVPGPYVGYGWGFGVGHGFGFFGFLGGLLFLFLLFALVRAAFGGGRGRFGGGYGHGWHRGGWTDSTGRSWEERAREVHDAWHRDHPDQASGPSSNDPSRT